MTDLTILLQRAKAISEEATPGPWESLYHNRTESWAITYPAEGMDPVNFRENVIVSAPDGRDFYSLNTDAIVTWRALIIPLLEVAKAADEIYGHSENCATVAYGMTQAIGTCDCGRKELTTTLANLSEIKL